ncbi:Protein of Unknown function [Marivirga sericea]|uniref:DUF2784 domain-containing protein n=1 Tax=Marivirga sericea TaxID=1028 RepID=A0A1X7KBJ1_9BACT|nr:DUF2784 family protein [Marivirga sericea]SMG38161.1 Protein of Unknown function [Marivirga sericea]
MNESILYILNAFFFIFHGVLILFNVFGWLFRKTRIWNLVTLLATACSWFILGAWKGWGYCPCTDWHWTVRSELGLQIETNSYIDFLLINLLGINLPKRTVDIYTLIIFLTCLGASIWVNSRKIDIIK